MKLSERLEDWMTRFQEFKGTKWSVPVSILLSALLCILVSFSCFGVILVPILMFAIPYWFGERRVLRFLIAALLISLILAGAMLLISTVYWYNYVPDPSESGGPNPILREGSVSPHAGEPDTLYNFTVAVYLSDFSVEDVRVYLNISDVREIDETDFGVPYLMSEVNSSDTNLSDGKWYYYTGTLPERVNFHHFAVKYGDNWTTTLVYVESMKKYESTFGPINMSFWSLAGILLSSIIIMMVFSLALFLIIMLLYWWTRKAKEVRVERAERMGIDLEEGEYECTECGADVPVEASFCPKCGASFEEKGEEASEEE